MSDKTGRRNRRTIRPSVPDDLDARGRSAFSLYDELLPECAAAGWTLLIAVRGNRGRREVVLELRRGTRVARAAALRECASWRVADRVWLQVGREPEPCESADHARALVRRTMAAGDVANLRRLKFEPPSTPAPAPCRLRGRSLAYLTRNTHDRDS